MPTVQSTFSEDIAYGFAGQQSDGILANVESFHLEGSTACEFGRPVYQGSADRGATLTVSANGLGIALAHKGLPVTADRAADTYAPGDEMAIMTQGRVWVTSATVASKGDQVYVTSAGVITGTSGGNTALTGWFFDDTITAAGIVRIVKR